MPNKWVSALKEMNKGSNNWCVPKKGTAEYQQVMNIMNKSSITPSTKSAAATKIQSIVRGQAVRKPKPAPAPAPATTKKPKTTKTTKAKTTVEIEIKDAKTSDVIVKKTRKPYTRKPKEMGMFGMGTGRKESDLTEGREKWKTYQKKF